MTDNDIRQAIQEAVAAERQRIFDFIEGHIRAQQNICEVLGKAGFQDSTPYIEAREEQSLWRRIQAPFDTRVR